MALFKKMLVVLAISIACTMIINTASARQYRVVKEHALKGGAIKLFFKDIAKAKREHMGRAILGPSCYSACTLYLGLMDSTGICADPETKFKFHRFSWTTDIQTKNGKLVSYKRSIPLTEKDPALNRRAWTTYPHRVRKLLLNKTRGKPLPGNGSWVTISAVELGLPTCPEQ